MEFCVVCLFACLFLKTFEGNNEERAIAESIFFCFPLARKTVGESVTQHSRGKGGRRGERGLMGNQRLRQMEGVSCRVNSGSSLDGNAIGVVLSVQKGDQEEIWDPR